MLNKINSICKELCYFIEEVNKKIIKKEWYGIERMNYHNLLLLTLSYYFVEKKETTFYLEKFQNILKTDSVKIEIFLDSICDNAILIEEEKEILQDVFSLFTKSERIKLYNELYLELNKISPILFHKFHNQRKEIHKFIENLNYEFLDKLMNDTNLRYKFKKERINIFIKDLENPVLFEIQKNTRDVYQNPDLKQKVEDGLSILKEFRIRSDK